MFWGVTLENGKRYSQVVDSSYHLSMAALEPQFPESQKYVSVMLEHNKQEFLLCTLEANRVLQVHLEHCFVEGEEVTYFLNGDGTVHLTGYIITDDIEGEEGEDSELEEARAFTNRSLKMQAKRAAQEDSEEDSEEEDEEPEFIGKKKHLSPETNNISPKMRGNPMKISSDSKGSPAKMKPEEHKKSPQMNKNSIGDQNNRAQLKKEALSKVVPAEDSSDDEDDEEFTIDEDEEDEESDEEEDSDDEEDDEANGHLLDDVDDEEIQASLAKKQRLEEGALKGNSSFESSGKVKTPPNNNSLNMSQNQEKGSSKKKNKKNANSPLQNKSPVKGEPFVISKSPSSQGQSVGTSQVAGAKRKSFGGVEQQDLVIGNGPLAKPGKMAHVYYRGTLANKKEFDSCTKGKPFSFRLGKAEVIKGWDVGVQGMKVGGKRMLVIPPAMGYGSKRMGDDIPANSTLHFEIELKAIS